jgi:hypothetical protein
MNPERIRSVLRVTAALGWIIAGMCAVYFAGSDAHAPIHVIIVVLNLLVTLTLGWMVIECIPSADAVAARAFLMGHRQGRDMDDADVIEMSRRR